MAPHPAPYGGAQLAIAVYSYLRTLHMPRAIKPIDIR